MIIQQLDGVPAAAHPLAAAPAEKVVALPVGHAEAADTRTPAGLQDRRDLARRRAFVAALNLATMALLAWGIGTALGAGGWSAADLMILLCFLIGAPWTVLGMWNAAIGLWLLHARRGGLAAVAPFLPAGERTGPLSTRTALAMTVRNEPPARSYRRLAAMRGALDATGQGHHFDVAILSDTTDPQIAAEEEHLFHLMRGQLGGQRAFYRRRSVNTGWKAGNVREFLTGPGRAYDFYLPLDSDSYMGAETILRLVRIMEAHPPIGILQSMSAGMPSGSLFARALSFGSRVASRAHLTGASWWHGDTCYYWGHNALIRAAPFRRHCRLPVLPGRAPLGGHILSHDLPEAAMMRRAGYECRVVPVEMDSWEENPPTVLDFIRRELRWCNGNMQATRLQGLRGLTPLSRFHLFTAGAMFLGAPAWMLMAVAAATKILTGDAGIDVAVGTAMFLSMLMVSLAPKAIGLADVALTPGGAGRFGGGWRLAIGGAAELVLSILMAPVVAFQATLFLAGLAFGKRVPWSGQNRAAYRVGWAEAARRLWPQTLFGLALLALGWALTDGGAVVWGLPMLAGLVLAVPFAVLSAAPGLGGLGRTGGALRPARGDRAARCAAAHPWRRPGAAGGAASRGLSGLSRRRSGCRRPAPARRPRQPGRRRAGTASPYNGSGSRRSPRARRRRRSAR